MWNLWLKSKNFGKLPSDIFGEEDSLAAWMLDNAVQWFGLTIENALSERVELKMGPKTISNPRYTLTRLLNSSFKLPKPQVEEVEAAANPLVPFLQLLGKPNGLVKRYQYVAPEKKESE